METLPNKIDDINSVKSELILEFFIYRIRHSEIEYEKLIHFMEYEGYEYEKQNDQIYNS